jgi:hypothetical protein
MLCEQDARAAHHKKSKKKSKKERDSASRLRDKERVSSDSSGIKALY